jgi:hypothetical protein
MDGPGATDSAGKMLFSYAHPRFWAPFTILGDGAASEWFVPIRRCRYHSRLPSFQARLAKICCRVNNPCMSKARIVLEIITLLQGTPVDEFARQNLFADGDRVIVRCAEATTLATPEGQACKRAIATALIRYSYRLTMAQLAILSDLYVSALQHLEPEALVRVRDRMCDATSVEAQRDADAARAVCERVSIYF